MSVKFKAVIFWIALAFFSFFFVPSNWLGGVVAQSLSTYSFGRLINLFIFFIPLFAFAYMIAYCCRLLKYNSFLCFFVMAFFNSAFFLMVFNFGLRGITAAALSSGLIFVAFAAEEIFRRYLARKRAVNLTVNILFSLLSLSCIFGAPFAGIKIIANTYELKKRAMEEELSKRKVSDADVAPYFKAALAELSEHYKFKDFPSIFKDVEDCRFSKLSEKRVSLSFYASHYRASFIFKEDAAILTSSIYFQNSGRLRDIGNNESEFVNASFTRKAGEKMKPTADISVYNRKISSNGVLRKIEIEGDEVIKRMLLAEDYMQKLEAEYRNRNNKRSCKPKSK